MIDAYLVSNFFWNSVRTIDSKLTGVSPTALIVSTATITYLALNIMEQLNALDIEDQKNTNRFKSL